MTPTKKELLEKLQMEDPLCGHVSGDLNRPNDIHGWGEMDILRAEVEKAQPRVAVEIGSWLGRSAVEIARAMPEDSCLICIDTSLGSFEHWTNPEYREMLFNERRLITDPFRFQFLCYEMNSLYSSCMLNLSNYGVAHKILPLRLPSDTAFQVLRHYGVSADFVYIDGDHTTEQVQRDIKGALKLVSHIPPGSVILCDDYDWDSVKTAIARTAKCNEVCDYLKRSRKLCVGSPIGERERVFKFVVSYLEL